MSFDTDVSGRKSALKLSPSSQYLDLDFMRHCFSYGGQRASNLAVVIEGLNKNYL